MTPQHDHSRPGRAAQLAAILIVRALIADDRAAIRRAATAGGCPSCTAVAVAAYGIGALVPVFTGQPGMTPDLARAVLAAVEVTEAELRAAPN